jgi:SAM-dependent methyltransferase
MNCICCLSTEVVPGKPLHGYRMMACRNCGFAFVHPLPSPAEIEAFYNKTRVVADLKQIIRGYIAAFDRGENAPKHDWFGHVIAEAKQLTGKEKLNILEVGSGYGYFVHYAKKQGHLVKGTEVTRDYAEAGSSVVGDINYVEGGDYDKVVSDGWADLIYLEHVFEHVLQPDELMPQLKRKLAPGGVLHISVPNSRSFLSRVMGARWPWATPPDHLYYYTKKSLGLYLQNRGFQVERSYTGDYFFRSIAQLYSFTPYVNFLRKKLGVKAKPYAYRYPSLTDLFNLLPYWILWPFLKLMGAEAGNELTVVAKHKHADP